MNGKFAKWSLIQLLMIIMVFAAGSAFAAGEALLHNSQTTGSTKWGGSWGVAGGQYGEFTCTTCHSSTTTGPSGNIKKIVASIPATIGVAVVKPVTFNNMTGFGDDSVSHATSTKICEVCHTQTIAHQYNTANAPQSGDLTHANGDCTQCHMHADGFKASGHLVPLYATTAGHTGCASGIGCHTNSNPAAPYPAAAGVAPDCRVCHAKADPTVALIGCGSCHGVANGTGEPSGTVYPDIAGSHSVHTPLALCTECHAGGGTGSNANHGKGNRGTNPAVVNLAAAYTWNGTNCTTASCHADVYGSGTVPSPAWGTAAGCEACHSIVIGANGPDTGGHTAHAGKACTSCHASGTTSTSSPSTGHADGDIDVTVGGYPATAKHTSGSGYNSCSNLSCHSNGFFTAKAATWGSQLDCAGCHETTALTSGKHNKHMNSTISSAYTCGSCHAATAQNATTLVPATTTHMNNANEVGFAVNGSFAAGTCAVYCHSYGTASNAPFTVKTAASWTGAAATCYSCHGSDSTTGLLNNMSTGRHKKHMVGQYTYRCATCHASSVSFSNNTTITDPSKHVNVQIDVGFSGVATTGGASATYTNSGHAPGQPGTINDSCQNIYCHSNAQVQPGHANPQFRNLTGNKRFSLSTAAGLGCTGCHGSSTTTGQWALSGKHLAHTASPVSFNCNQCHLSGGTNSNRINHANGLANYSSQWTGRATLADGTCNNVYCHSNGKGVFVNMTNANWFSARTLDCKACHGGTSSQAGEPNYVSGAAGSATANSHPIHVTKTGIDASCQNCHSNTVTGVLLNATTHNVTLGTSSRAIPYHADQSLSDVNAGVYSGNGKTFTYTAASKTCSNISCHSGNGIVAGVADAQWGGTEFTCESCHGGNAAATNKITSGQHGMHTNQAGVLGVNLGCVECHAQTVTNDTTLAAGNTHMNALANFSGAKAGKNKAACTAAYCHSNGKGDAGTTVSWTTGPALDCKGCHGGASSQAGEPVYTTTAPGTLKTNSHPKHVGTTGADTTCQNCHGATMNVALLSNSGNHLNGSINVIQGSDISKSFTYSNDSSKTCSNIDCHSGNGMFISNPIQWGATMPTDCTGCHANDVTAAALSGAHNAHINNASAGGNFRCKDCHAPTITNSDNRTIADANKHGNTIINYSGAKAGKNTNCSNIYCHSNGKGVFAAIPAWVGGSANCQSCHATGALLVDHSKHIAKGATCAQCHNATTSDSATITGSTHIDGTVNLQQSGTLFNGKAVSFAPSGTTCNNISCHSPYGSSTASATWGVAANCETCHPKAGLSGAHQVHMGVLDLTSGSIYYNMTANRTPAVAQVSETDRKHGFGCAECHPMDPASHLNGAINVDLNRVNVAGVGSLRFLNASSASYDMASTKKCSNIYCHSNASRIETESNVKANTSLAWTDTFAAHPELDRCAACHGNQPTTGAHAAHSVGVHTFNEVTLENGGVGVVLDGNIFNGVSGKVPITNKPNTAHGNPNNSTTIGCYICHNATVTSKANDKNYKCSPCHVTGSYNATQKGLAAISNLKNHVNGSREIMFEPVQVLSKAQIRPKGPNKTNSTFDFYSATWTRTSYKNMSTLSFDRAKVALNTAVMWHYSSPKESNCSNIACHNGNLVKWNLDNFHDPNKCMDCHNAL